MRQIAKVSRLAHSPPARNSPATVAAVPGASGWSSPITTITVIRLPICSPAWPKTRAKLQAKMARAASGSATAMPPARASPNPPAAAAPSTAKPSSGPNRARSGPPGSHRHVSSAPRAATAASGWCSRVPTATITATESAARSPSARLAARGSKRRGRRARSAGARGTEATGAPALAPRSVRAGGADELFQPCPFRSGQQHGAAGGLARLERGMRGRGVLAARRSG